MPKYKITRRHVYITDDTVIVNAPIRDGALMISGNLRLYPPPEHPGLRHDHSIVLSAEDYDPDEE